MTQHIVLIANPASGGGRGARRLPLAQQALDRVGLAETWVTEQPGDEGRLALAALQAGATTIAVLGGDGTWSKVAATLIATHSTVALAPMAAGKGNDFAKSIGVPAKDYAAVAAMIAGGKSRRIDAGRVSWEGSIGVTFVNAAGFGFDAAVVEDIGRVKWLRGDAVYIWSSLKQIIGYAGVRARVQPRDAASRTYLMIVAANGRNFGGSFLIAPDAKLDDGALDFITIDAAGSLRRLALFGKAARGAHIGEPEVVVTVAPSATISFDQPPVLEVDGDLYTATGNTVRVDSVPGALAVVCA